MCDSLDNTSTEGARLGTVKREQRGLEDGKLLSLAKRSRAHKHGNDVIKETSDPGNHLFQPSPSRQLYTSYEACTGRIKDCFKQVKITLSHHPRVVYGLI